MPYYTMNCQKAECRHSEDVLMKYDDMQAGVSCPKCDTLMKNQICAPMMISDFGTGPGLGGGKKRHKLPDVGPLSKSSKAYEKKMDDANSSDAHKPGGTFGSGGAAGFKKRQDTLKQMDKGETNFTK